MNRITSYEQLKNLSDKELFAIHDEIAGQTSFGVSYFQQEIHQREQNKLTDTMKKYTYWILVMTAVMTIATIVNVILFLQKP